MNVTFCRLSMRIVRARVNSFYRTITCFPPNLIELRSQMEEAFEKGDSRSIRATYRFTGRVNRGTRRRTVKQQAKATLLRRNSTRNSLFLLSPASNHFILPLVSEPNSAGSHHGEFIELARSIFGFVQFFHFQNI